MKKFLATILSIIMMFCLTSANVFAEESQDEGSQLTRETVTVVQVNKTHDAYMYYNGQTGNARYRTTGTYKLHVGQYNIYITDINLYTSIISIPPRWQAEITGTEYNSQYRYVRVLVRVRYMGDNWDSPMTGWHYDAVTYDV